MTEPENFIARWSRRKAAQTERRDVPTETPSAEPLADDAKRDETHSAVPPLSAQSETEPKTFDLAPFDLATLPPIESIGIGTDISAFLRAGVPAELTRAALRRAWSTDPAIRDFIGLSENAWDFTAPDGVPGFGPLSAADASRLMAEYTGKAKEIAKEVIERVSAPKLPAAPEHMAPPPNNSVLPQVSADDADSGRTQTKRDQSAQESQAIADESSYVQRDKENNATQHDPVESVENLQPAHRTHGSALPE